MKRFAVILLAVLLTITVCGCKPDYNAILESYIQNTSSDTETSEIIENFDLPASTSSKAPAATTSKATTSVVSVTSKAEEIVLNEITTPDGEKAVEITVNKDPVKDDDDSDSSKPSGPALPPSIEDLEDTEDFDEVSTSSDTTSVTTSQNSDTEGETTTSSDSATTTSDGGNSTPTEHIAVDFKDRYRYSLLSVNEKVLYRQILTAAEEIEYKVVFKQTYSFAQVANILQAVVTDNPEYFYLCMAGIIKQDMMGNAVQIDLMFSDGEIANTDSNGYYTAVSSTLKSRILSKRTVFNAKTKSILSKIDPALSPVKKQKLIYDKILADSYYNTNYQWTEAVPDDWTAYGVLIKGTGVCESYSEAFQHLCLQAGINCTVIRGDAGGGHQWNAVQLDNEWYECDITFDDPIGAPSGVAYRHTYFNLTTEKMRELNHFARSDEPAPIATGTKYSYKNSFNN